MSKSMSKSGGESASTAGALSYTQLYGSPVKARYSLRFSGLIELNYKDYNTETKYMGNKFKSSSQTFEQKFRLRANGFIYHPKLLNYFAEITFNNSKTKYKAADDSTWNARDISYTLSTTFLPTRPVSLDVFATRSYNKMDGVTVFDGDSVSNFYGARFYSTLKKFPNIRIEYSHWDYSTDRMTGKRAYDEFLGGFDIIKEKVEYKFSIDKLDTTLSGNWNAIKTKYFLVYSLSKYSYPNRDFSSTRITLNTKTQFNKGNSLWTAFQYYKIDTSRLISFSADYKPQPLKNIYHDYNFEFTSSKSGEQTSDRYTLAGIWRYRISNRIFARANMRIQYGTVNDDDRYAYKLDTTFNYGKPYKIYDFNALYNFILSQEKNSNDLSFMENSLDLNLSTRKYKWGKIFAGYRFSYRTFKYSFNSPYETESDLGDNSSTVEHKARLGSHVRGPWKASWSVELEARFMDSSGNKLNSFESVWLGESQNAKKIRHYTASCHFRYPILKRGSIILSGSYTTGQTNSQDIRKYNYEGRFNYTFFRGLNFTAWWREEFRSKGWWNTGILTTNREFYTDTRTRDYEFDLYYTWRQMFFSLELTSTKLDEGYAISETRRFNLKASRTF